VFTGSLDPPFDIPELKPPVTPPSKDAVPTPTLGSGLLGPPGTLFASDPLKFH